MLPRTSIPMAFLLCLVASHANAGEKAADPGACFAELLRFGAPDVSKATYAHLDRHWELGLNELLSNEFPTSGNAWLLAETRDAKQQPAKATFLINGAERIDVAWRSDAYAPPEDPLAIPHASTTEHAQWSKGNLAGDARTALRFLRWLASQRFPDSDFKPQTCGGLMLFALQVHQQGDAVMAGKLVEELVLRTGSQEKAIAAGMDALAEAHYKQAYRTFLVDRNWAAYRDNIKALLEKFRGRWRLEDGIKMLLDAVEDRLEKPEPAPTATLSAEDLKLATGLLSLRTIRCAPEYGSQPVLWLAPSLWKREDMPGDADLAIRARGMAAIPLLLALANDTALTEVNASQVSLNRRYRYIDRGRKQNPVDIFADLERPATRGEVALRILKELLPEAIAARCYSPADVVKNARAYMEELEKRTEDDLISESLTDRYGNPSRQTTESLLKRATTAAVAALEKFLVQPFSSDSHDLGEYWARGKEGLLPQYVALRGLNAQPLVDQCAELVRKQASHVKKPANHSFADKKDEEAHIEGQRKQLADCADRMSRLKCPASLDELLAQPEDAPYRRQMLMAMLRTIPPGEAAGRLLRRAVSADKLEAYKDAVGLLRGALSEEGQIRPQGLKPTDFAAEWTTAIRNSEEFLLLHEALFSAPLVNPPARVEHSDRGGATLSTNEVAARLIAEFGQLAVEFVRQRVQARLSGVPEEKLPQYPCDAPLPEAARAALKARFAGVTRRLDAQRILAELSLLEREALADVLRGDAELNARLCPLAGEIVEVTLSQKNPALQEKLSNWKGKALSIELVRELETWCRAEAEAGRGATCVIGRHKDFSGCDIRVSERVAAANAQLAGFSGLACAPDLYAVATWRTAPPPKAMGWRTVQTSGRTDQEAFWKAAEVLVGTTVPASCESFIRFTFREESLE